MILKYMEYNNYKKPDAGCDKYGIPRLEMAVYLRDNILNLLDIHWFIENGTLLGAIRNNKFIPHDDDFDIGILIDSKDEIDTINQYINKLLPSKYKSRIIDTYSNKIEIYQPEYGNYKLLGPKYKNADYHYITIDLQFYLKIKNDDYLTLYFIFPFDIIINKKYILPVKNIELEGEIFPCPNNSIKFLESHYGSIDPNAKFNSKTCKYELT
jgi:phosphorylcholine metabolism protein LicD